MASGPGRMFSSGTQATDALATEACEAQLPRQPSTCQHMPYAQTFHSPVGALPAEHSQAQGPRRLQKRPRDVSHVQNTMNSSRCRNPVIATMADMGRGGYDTTGTPKPPRNHAPR
ncbi:hypothetical protein GTA08_BOTSDO08482 [Botryosphaeria dothidea]|uniref:Uncharacterized protein n=1 Tax=Botryosphaeria dothidea TaxID=55169 RepID=A0A8H4IMN1_9PEZI|nr:hypothetical protein GTA08_BOTSDO08482 [Botryosphaeria dothidea]